MRDRNIATLHPLPAATPITLVDSCVIFDVAYSDPVWREWSENALIAAMDRGHVAINALIYAEISVGYSMLEELDDVLGSDYLRLPLPYHAAFLAGKAFRRYNKSNGVKRSPLPDFYIGAHAAVEGHALLTRDAQRYRTYFPTLEVIAPI